VGKETTGDEAGEATSASSTQSAAARLTNATSDRGERPTSQGPEPRQRSRVSRGQEHLLERGFTAPPYPGHQQPLAINSSTVPTRWGCPTGNWSRHRDVITCWRAAKVGPRRA
jgi:hypothetical protein